MGFRLSGFITVHAAIALTDVTIFAHANFCLWK